MNAITRRRLAAELDALGDRIDAIDGTADFDADVVEAEQQAIREELARILRIIEGGGDPGRSEPSAQKLLYLAPRPVLRFVQPDDQRQAA